MTSPKSGHYEQQLFSALCRGAWADSQPGKSPKAEGLNWSELLRKYNKHNPDTVLATVASQTQALALLLARRPSPSVLEHGPAHVPTSEFDLDGNLQGDEDGLDVGEECMLDTSGREETEGNLEELRSTRQRSEAYESVQLIEAYYAFARGDYEQCLQLVAAVDLNSGAPPERTNTRASAGTRSYVHKHSVTSTADALPQSAAIAGAVGALGLVKKADPDIDAARVWWIAERVRSTCLEGMSYEKLADESSALRAYEKGISLLESLSFKGPDNSKGRSDVFAKYRELWRWAERLLWRASIVSARNGSLPQALRILRAYHLHALYWVAAFRPLHRSAVYRIYIRALCLSSPLEPQFRTTHPINVIPLPEWTAEARGALEEYKFVLEATTKFPRAGEVNRKVVDFSDLCIAVWERGGESEDEAAWLIEVLWWTTTLTFHSHRIMRHLTRLLLASGNVAEAKRTFRLYVQLVTKARETSAGDVSLQLQRRPTGDPPANPQEIAADGGDYDELGTGRDADSDRTFVGAVVLGVRMLSRWPDGVDDAREACRMAELAKEILGNSRSRRDHPLHAQVENAVGIARGVQAALEMDPESRPRLQAAALDSLRSACDLDPSSADTFYHLAYMQAESRDIDAAVLSARQAVERNSRDVRAWHLLGLLLTAQGDYQGALSVLTLGFVEAEAQEELQREAIAGPSVATGEVEGVTPKDFVAMTTSEAHVGQSVDTTTSLPYPQEIHGLPSRIGKSSPSSTVLLPSDSIPQGYILHKPLLTMHTSRAERFEFTLQLHVTQNAIIELLEGPESANDKWLNIFAFFSEKCPAELATSTESKRNSFETTRTLPATDSVRQVETLPTVQESGSGSVQIPRVVTRPPPESNNGHEDGHYEMHRTLHKTAHQREGHKEAQRVDLNEFRMRSHRLLQGGQKHIQSLSRKIIHKGGTQGARLQRSNSAPDFKSPTSASVYQASSIHSRMPRYPSPGGGSSSVRHTSSRLETVSPPPPPPPDPDSHSSRRPRETRLLSDLWLTSAATFRRMDKIEQARAAIQEAEVIDPENPNVWVQLGLYFAALETPRLAIESFHKALVIDPDHIPASVHLAQQYLFSDNADLAAGLLTTITQGAGWDVAEAWYFLAKACAKQGRRERERECLIYALRLEESKTIRPLQKAVPRCL